MKTRMGFVSNSSSSSFIIGIAVVKDLEKFKAWKEKLNHRCLEMEQANKQRDGWNDLEQRGSTLLVQAFDCHGEVSLSKDQYENEDMIAYFCFIGNEGDPYFMSNLDDEDSDIDYRMVNDDDFFDKSEQDLMEGFNSDNGLEHAEICTGAARNG